MRLTTLPHLPNPIELVTGAGFDDFFTYLNGILKDNGDDGIYFQPLSKAESNFPQEKEKSFRAGATIAIGHPGWRRTWVIRDSESHICGHIDLRSHTDSGTAHRCVLGMGVSQASRKQGLGRALLAHAEQWAESSAGFLWMDLQVLSNNAPAVALYECTQFVKVGEIPEMFMLDGQAFSYTYMTKRLGKP